MRKYLLFTTLFLSLFLTQNISAQITNLGNTFTPDTITITTGTAITFSLIATHNAVEVDQATWIANGMTSNGGFNIPFGGGSFTPVIAQTYYYVCQPHAGMGMKGVIIVNPLLPVTLDSVVTTTPIMCYGDIDTVTVYMTQTTPGTPVKLLNYKYTGALLFAFGSSGITTGETQPFSSLGWQQPLVANYRVFIVDSALVYAAYPPQTQNPNAAPNIQQAQLQNPTDPLLSEYMDFMVDSSPPQLIVSGNIVPPPPAVGNSINIFTSGGAPGYTYSWTGPNAFGSSSANITNLSPGNYTVIATDLNGCDDDSIFTIPPPPPSWDCNPGNGCSDPGTGLGSYNDSLVCAQICPMCDHGNSSAVNVTCFPALDGQIQINNAFGAPPFTYSLDTVPFLSPLYPTQLSTNSTWTTNDTSHTFSSSTPNSSGNYQLGKATYYYTFEDSNGCDSTVTIFVNRDGEPFVVDTLIAFVSDTINLNGAFTINLALGSGYPDTLNPSYNYVWYNSLGNVLQNSSSNTLSSIDTGLYSVVITDNGPYTCSSYPIILQMNLAPTCFVDNFLLHNICPGASEGQVSLNLGSGWSGSQFFDLSFDSIGLPNRDTIGGLNAGIYNFILTPDTTSTCTIDTVTIEILEPELYLITRLNTVSGDILCSNDSTQIIVEFDNPDPSISYTYQIRDVFGNPLIPANPVGDTSFQYLIAGDYSIRLYQNNAWCVPSSYPFIIDEYQLDIVDVVPFPDVCGSQFDGSITVQIDLSPSNPPISYFINGASILSSSNLSETFFPVTHGFYDSIYVKDNLGCEVYWDILVEVKDSISTNISPPIVIKETCRENDGIISFIPSGGASPYTVLINSVLSATVDEPDTVFIIGLTAGTYIISVIDSDSCAVPDFEVIVEKVVPLELLSIDKIKESCCGFDGSIFTNILKGDGDTVEYRISFDNIAIAIDSNVGVYPFMDGLNVWPSQSFITDFNNDPAHIQDSANFVNLTRGYYKINISDEFGCQDSVDYISYLATTSSVNTKLGIDTSLASQLDMQISFTNMLCYDSINATVQVLYPNVCYDYQLWLYNDTLNPNLITTDSSSSIDSLIYYDYLYKGIYGVQAISYSKYPGCVVRSDTFEILEPEVISYDSPLSSAVYCTNPGTCDGEVWLPNSPVGGIPDTSSFAGYSVYKYYINRVNTSVNYFSGPILSDSMFSGLCVGEYEVQVLDGNNCIIRDTVSVLDSSLYIDSFLVTTISCYDSSDAVMEVYVHGGKGPIYTYVWKDSTNTIVDSLLISQTDSLTEGMYFVTVYDSVGCFAMDSASVLPAPNQLALAAKREDYSLPESCLGESYDGSIAFEIRGGTKPYTFNWELYNNPAVNGSYTANAIYCDTCTSYQWDHIQFDSIYVLDGLTADLYRISITDANGCSDTLWLPIDSFRVLALNQNHPLIIDTILYPDSVCYGTSTGEIIINVNDSATWPLIYSIDSGLTSQADSFFLYLYADTFNIVVTDVYGCTIDTTVIINQYDSLGIFDEKINVSCYNGNDGSIEVSAFGGVGPYDWQWDNTISIPVGHPQQLDPLIENLQIGTYTVTVTDSKGCVAVADSIEIIQPSPVQLFDTVIQDVSCNGGDDGQAEVSVLGGTPGYTYLWDNGGTDSINYSLEAVLNTCTVTDANECTASITVDISEPTQLELTLQITNNLCAGEANGVITIMATGGTPSYQYSLNNDTPQPNSTFSNLSSNDYLLSVFDINDCPLDSSNVLVTDSGEIILTATVTSLSCYQSEDGKLEIIFTGGVAPYEYTINRSGSFFDNGIVFEQMDALEANNLNVGNYSIVVTDHHGCKDTLSGMLVDQPDEIIADFILSEILINKGKTVYLTNLSSPLSGNNPVNQFIWDFGDGSQEDYAFEPTHQYITQGSYIISLTANNLDLSDDCSSTFTSSIDVEGYDVNNVFTPNGDKYNEVFHFNDEMLSKLYVRIYNRWGVKVYHWETPQGSWDGKGYNGELLPEGVYFFTMEATGEKGNSYIEKGSITLIR